MPDGQVLEFTNVTKRFYDVTAVSDFTARVEPGAVTAFLGPNGAGKTTTLRILLGQVRQTNGTATIGGVAYADLRQPLRTIGAVLEETVYRPRRTASRQLAIAAKANGIPLSRVDEVLDLVGLSADAEGRIGTFSLGMRQRLSVAHALLGDAGALVFDEPANGLDPEGIRWMRLLMRRLADEGRTVLVSSHVLSEVEQVADHVLVLSKGQLVLSAGIESLADPSAGSVVVDAIDRAGLTAALAAAGFEVEVLRSGLTVRGGDARTVGSVAASAGIALSTLVQRGPTLEDVFIDLVRGGKLEPRAVAAATQLVGGDGADPAGIGDGAVAGVALDGVPGMEPRADAAGQGDAGAAAVGDADAGDADPGDADGAGDSEVEDSEAGDGEAGDGGAGNDETEDSGAGNDEAGDGEAGDDGAGDSDAGDSGAGNTEGEHGGADDDAAVIDEAGDADADDGGAGNDETEDSGAGNDAAGDSDAEFGDGDAAAEQGDATEDVASPLPAEPAKEQALSFDEILFGTPSAASDIAADSTSETAADVIADADQAGVEVFDTLTEDSSDATDATDESAASDDPRSAAVSSMLAAAARAYYEDEPKDYPYGDAPADDATHIIDTVPFAQSDEPPSAEEPTHDAQPQGEPDDNSDGEHRGW